MRVVVKAGTVKIVNRKWACPFSVENQDVKKMKSKEEHSNLETTYRTIPGDDFFPKWKTV